MPGNTFFIIIVVCLFLTLTEVEYSDIIDLIVKCVKVIKPCGVTERFEPEIKRRRMRQNARKTKDMPITDFLERNAREYPNDICLVEINPEIQEDRRVT